MEAQNNSTEIGDRQPSDLPNPGEKDNSVETSDQVPLPSSQQNAAARHPLATEPFEDILKVLADLERDDSCSTCRTIWTPMGVVRVQAYRRPEARAGEFSFGGGWCAPENKERWSSASPRQTTRPAAFF